MPTKQVDPMETATTLCDALLVEMCCPRCGGQFRYESTEQVYGDQIERVRLRCGGRCKAHLVVTVTMRFDRAKDEGHIV